MTMTAMAGVLGIIFCCSSSLNKSVGVYIAASKRNAQKLQERLLLQTMPDKNPGEIFVAIATAYEMSDDNPTSNNTCSDDPQGTKDLFSLEFKKLYGLRQVPKVII